MWHRIIAHFEERYGESILNALDYGKLLIIALCIYIALEV